MPYSITRKRQAKILRTFRKVHRLTGSSLFVFFFCISVSGVILGWKSNSAGVILPESANGTTPQLEAWLPISTLHETACNYLLDSISNDLSLTLDRIDIRKEKGIVKFVFKEHFWEVQLDGASGALLSLEKRHSDFIENLHDGSVLDTLFNTTGQPLKLIYTSIMGTALFVFTITGFWLWFGPKRMKIKKLQV